MRKEKINLFFENQLVVDASNEGTGIVKPEGERVIFVQGTLPGDIIDLEVVTKKKNYYIGKIVKLITPSANRIVPKCVHFGLCGGCKWQNLDYETQLFYKQKQVTDAFERLTKDIQLPIIQPIIGADNPYYYRNKLEFTFSEKRCLTKEELGLDEITNKKGLGFHIAGAFDKVLDIQECHLQNPIINAIRNEIREFALENNISFFNIKEQTGILRTLVFRTSLTTNELMLNLIITENNPQLIDNIFTHLQTKFSVITSFLWMYNPKKNDSYYDLEYRCWKGKSYITENLGNYEFQISSISFFQTNTAQALKLYQTISQLISKENKHIYDLYCGTGTIGIFLSKFAQKITGIEYSQTAINDAKTNAIHNGINHIEFFAGDINKLLNKDFIAQNGMPDVLILDPPRAGLEGTIPATLLEIACPTMIYVSCNPTTQARDIQLLSEKYNIETIQPVDMFPQTAHVENIIVLRLR